MDETRRSATDPEASLERLRAELDEGLAADPEVLVYPVFLGVLHRELRERLGGEDAEAVLLRAGFFHGLRDALRTLRTQANPEGQHAGPPPFSPLLAMRMASEPPGPGAERRVRGEWPEAVEARALAGVEGVAQPGCVLSAGYTAGWLSGLWDEDVLAVEETCRARGDAACRFTARAARAWRASEDATGERLLAKLPFEPLWQLAGGAAEGEATTPPPGTTIDRSSPAVHVWGPVMVVPYGGLETAAAVEAIAHEPAGREVSVVVIDLAGAMLDEGFGAAALERTLAVIESWGAEAILTGVSPLCEPVLADLDRKHLVLRKDLPEAVAAAFQIADAQRRPA